MSTSDDGAVAACHSIELDRWRRGFEDSLGQLSLSSSWWYGRFPIRANGIDVAAWFAWLTVHIGQRSPGARVGAGEHVDGRRWSASADLSAHSASAGLPSMVDSANAYSEFLKSAFDAEVSDVLPLPSDPERVMHAEARIGTGVVFFADSGAHGERCLRSPSEPVHVQLWTTVPDADAVYARAVAAGATPAQEVTAQDDGSRMGGFVDPFGTLWWVSTTSGSVYHALKAMTGQGLLLVHETTPSAAGGPPRMEYEVTKEGKQVYFTLLRTALTSHDPRLDLLAAAVGLIDDLPRSQALDLLRQRAQAMDDWRANIAGQLPPDTNLETWGPIGEVIGLWLHTAESRAQWTRRLIRRLEKGAFRMAGED